MTKRAQPIFQLKVSLREIHPPIWRSVQLPEDTKLPRLHRILQLLFNWEDYHLHEFRLGKRLYGVPDPDDALYGRKVIDESLIPLNRIVQRVGDTVQYVYDFGDNWRHDLLLEGILLPSPDTFYPRCVAGARNGPPEDAGGAGGYARYLEAIADPDHDEHEELLAWRGPFDSEAFSLEAVNASLKRTLHRPPPTKKRAPARAKRDVDYLTRVMLAALDKSTAPGRAKKRVAPGTALPLELTDPQRELILENSFAPDELTARLRLVPQRGKPAVARYTLGELDELAGHVAAEANHAKNRKVAKQWDGIFDKMTAILESYTDEEE
jgi:hypothetical protein